MSNATVLKMLYPFIKLFTCNHANTLVHEGKCYCPDCGNGLIYQWVILRCCECQTRRESRYQFRQVVPVQRCCLSCGAQNVRAEYLQNPSYFQLKQARLAIIVEESTDAAHWFWIRYLLGTTLSDYLTEIWQLTRVWIDAQLRPAPSKPAFTLIPAYVNSNAI